MKRVTRASIQLGPVAALALVCINLVVWAALPAGAAVSSSPDPSAASVLAGGLVDATRLGVQPLVVEVRFASAGLAASADFASCGALAQYAWQDRVQCLVAAANLPQLAALPGAVSVTLPSEVVAPVVPSLLEARAALGVRPQQAAYGYGATVSEAVQLTNASAFQANGIAGAGAQIAIIANGFTGYADAEIPPPLTRSFRADASMDGGTALGTAMAEVVADMVPQASLTLLAVDTALSLREAVQWVTSQGNYTAVVCAVGLVEGPFDGTDLVSVAVNQAAQAGVLWIQASGDLALRHWQGNWRDTNGDTFCDFGRGSDGVAFNLAAGSVFRAYLSWFETAGPKTAQDYDLALYRMSGTTSMLVAQSSVTQNGNTPPQEALLASVAVAGVYELRIKLIQANPSAPDRFQLYTPDLDMPITVQVTQSSLPAPAMATGAFTVGATTSVDTLETFSGRGPTLTGGMKPDMVGPDQVSTSVTGYSPFLSTAAGAAHVAGAAALLFSEDNTRDSTLIKQVLLSRAIPLPDAAHSPNNDFGYGRLSLRVGLDTQPPVISVLQPQNSTTISSRTPAIQVRITDLGSGVDPASIKLRIDGALQTGFTYDATSGLLNYLVTTPLALGSHEVQVEVSDRSGSVSSPAVVNFRVALPMVDAGIHMFSLPYSFPTGDVPTPAEVFGDPSVQMARWWPGDRQYHAYPDAYGSFSPPDALPPTPVVTQPPAGLGYFVRLSTSSTLNITGVPLGGVDPYAIRLSAGTGAFAGWNMIGCPFTSSVEWGSAYFVTNGVRQNLAQAVAAGVTEGVLFSFHSTVAGGYYEFSPDPLAAVMEPFAGYWLHVLKDTTLVLYPPALSLTQTPAPVAVGKSDGWRFQLIASAADALDPCNYVGVSSAAPAGYSPAYAVGEPPSVDSRLRVSLVEDQWGERSGYYAQVVKPAAARQSWEVEVACELTNVEVTLRWPELNAQVPTGTTLLLQDLDSGEEIFMRTSGGYSFRSGSEGTVRHLRLVAVQGEAGNLSLSGVSAQAATGGTVAITYALSQPGELTAEVRNISGVAIKRFASQRSAGGTVELLMWNGRSDRGSKAPPGRYLLRLTARTDDGQTVQAIRPFEVNP